MRPFYYVRTIEKILIGLIDMFNNMYVNKYDDMYRTTYSRSAKIPIITHNNANFTNFWSSTQYKQLTVPYPIGSIRFVSDSPDSGNRPQPTYAREIFCRSADRWIRDIQPTPYVFHFELQFQADNISDIFQIKENIQPYFNEYRTITIKEWDFAPEIPRPIPVVINSNTTELNEEVSDSDAQQQIYKVSYPIDCYGVYHRPYETPEMIKYAEMNFNIDEDLIHREQLLVYPSDIIQQKKKLWETVCPSIREGYSILHTLSTTLMQKQDADGSKYYEDVSLKHLLLYDRFTTTTYHEGLKICGIDAYNKDVVTKTVTQAKLFDSGRKDKDGNIIYENGYDQDGNMIMETVEKQVYVAGDIPKDFDDNGIPIYTYCESVTEDITKPSEVPSFDLLRFNFDYDTSHESDLSGFGRDFVAVNDESRKFIPNIAPGNGQEVEGGYAVEDYVDWSKILNWFGDNANGDIESSYTFKATIQFVEDTPGDTIFQYLSNDETTLSDGTVIPEGEVWFDWGMMNGRLYFTYHTSSKYKTFVSDLIHPNKETIYSFYFALYDKGDKGMFGVKTNFSDTMIALNTVEAS